MSKERLKSNLAYRSHVIGIDETNNNLEIISLNPHHPSSMIVTGYLGDNSQKGPNYMGSMYEDKCGVFGAKLDSDEARRRAKHFLRNNPHFFYTAMPRESSDKTGIIELRGDMIALLTFKFILSYALDPTKVQLIVDQIDGPERSGEVCRYLNELFSLRRLNVPIRFIQGAEHVKIPARKADRAGYWISALHFLGKNHKWPYGHRRVNLKSLDRLAVDFGNMAERDYPE